MAGEARHDVVYESKQLRIKGIQVVKRCGLQRGVDQRVLVGNWRDHTLGAVPFQEYVENDWLPGKHIEPTTRAAYVSNLTKHFFPFFGKKLMYQITPALVQDWVTEAAAEGLGTPVDQEVPHHATRSSSEPSATN